MKNNYLILTGTVGRCGTQFLNEALNNIYKKDIISIHEPEFSWSIECSPKKFYRFYKNLNGQKIDVRDFLEGSPATFKIVKGINEILKEKSIVIHGWTMYGILPFLMQYFQDKVKVIHLCRHPITNALSLRSHKLYQEKQIRNNPHRTGFLKEHMIPFPEEPGFFVKNNINIFGKYLYMWTEINKHILSLNNETVPWMRLRYEDIFDLDKNHSFKAKYLSFLGLPVTENFINLFEKRYDRFNLKIADKEIDIESEISQVDVVSGCTDVMKELNYSLDLNIENLYNRYVKKNNK